MSKREWELLSIDDILEQFKQKHGDKINPSLLWEGWPKITEEDLKDYQGRY